MRRHAKALIAVAALTLLALLGVATATADSAPGVAIEAPSAVKYTSAHLKGTVNPNGGPSQACWRFEYRPKEEEGENWQWTNFDCFSEEDSAKSEALPVSFDFNGFSPNTAYLVRLTASNEGGENSSSSEELKTEEVTPPSVSIEDADTITGESAHFEGAVTLASSEEAFNTTSCRFEYVSDAKFKEDGFAQASQIDCNPNPVTGAGETKVQAEPTNLEPHTTYHLRLRASNLGGESSAEASTFQTLAVAPNVRKTFVSNVSSTEAILNVEINPGGAATTYRFAYVSQAQFEASGFSGALLTPEEPLSGPADNSFHPAGALISELEPGTTYRYHAIATNSVSTTTGPDRVLHTFALPGAEPDTCPNATIRAAQHSTYLPDCRAYEMVSPPEKNGADVAADSGRVRASVDGNAVSFDSLTGFGQAQGTGIAIDYIAQRSVEHEPGDNGWNTHAITPYQEPLTLIAALRAQDPLYAGEFSDDLTHGVFRAWSPLSSAPNVSDVTNLYLRGDLLTPGAGTYSLLTDAELPQPARDLDHMIANNPGLAGASADFSTIAFESRLNLVAPASGPMPKAYLWDDSSLELLGVLPGGDPALCADEVNICSIVGEGAINGTYTQMKNVVSRDGTRVIFTAPSEANGSGQGSSEGALYQRIDGASTIQINTSERTDCAGDPVCGGDDEPDPAPSTPQPARFQWATPDGIRVFFTTSEQLTDDDDDGFRDLYRYDATAPEGHRLTRLSVDQNPSDTSNDNTQGVVGISDDGEYVYFITTGLLVSDTPGLAGQNEGIYLWHDGDLHLVAPLESSMTSINIPTTSAFPSARYDARVTPDGLHMLFVTTKGNGVLSLRGSDDYDHGDNKRVKYVYGAETDTLECASCNPSGAPATADAFTAIRRATGASASGSVVNRTLSDDGRLVFFSTEDSLLPDDTNGKSDVYDYDTLADTLHLISSGTGSSDSFFLNAGADGRDVFFLTRDRLAGWDHDTSADVYDARIDGGFPEPPPAPEICDGDLCHGPAAIPPTAASPGTPTFEGPPDPPVRHPKRCRRDTHRVRRHGRLRCVKRGAHRRRHRAADNDRRAVR